MGVRQPKYFELMSWCLCDDCDNNYGDFCNCDHCDYKDCEICSDYENYKEDLGLETCDDDDEESDYDRDEREGYDDLIDYSNNH